MTLSGPSWGGTPRGQGQSKVQLGKGDWFAAWTAELSWTEGLYRALGPIDHAQDGACSCTVHIGLSGKC